MMCFKDKGNLVNLRKQGVHTGKRICKGCWYEIDKVAGFLISAGIEINCDQVPQDQSETETNVPPQTPPKKKS